MSRFVQVLGIRTILSCSQLPDLTEDRTEIHSNEEVRVCTEVLGLRRHYGVGQLTHFLIGGNQCSLERAKHIASLAVLRFDTESKTRFVECNGRWKAEP